MKLWDTLLAWMQEPAPDNTQTVKLHGGPADGAPYNLTPEDGNTICLPIHLGKDGPAIYHRYIWPDDHHGLVYAGRCKQLIHPHPEEQQ